jgi:hypothetical protein
MKLALLGLLAALSLACLAAYEISHNPIPAVLAGVLALGAIWAGCGVLDTYKGEKRQ